MSPVVPEPLLRELGRTEGGSEALGLLVRDQHTRRLVLLRALLDAASAAPAAVCPPGRLDRLRQDWALLEAAERADRAAARSVLLHPLAGPWAQRCLRGLTAAAPTRELAADLAHFSALAAAAAIRAGLAFEARLTAPDGLLVLPTLGALRTGPGVRTVVGIAQAEGKVTIRQEGAGAVTVRLGDDGTHSDDPRWLPVLTLPAVLPGTAPVPLDDLDPYRTAGSGLQRFGLSSVAGLDESERAAWRELWAGVAPMLRIGGAHRTAETAALLRCLVPLSPPPGSTSGVLTGTGSPSTREGAAQCSGTRREAFGAILSSRPATAAHFASTLVHELQHTKLAALAALTPLHHEDATPRHFAPWRPDARPFDGLLQGAYSHIALADYWQRCALGTDRPSARDLAWAEHARCQQQVGAVLPVLAASGALTPAGRVLVNEMISMYHRLADTPPPPGHLARAVAYVRTARMIWRQRNAS
ncbi:HEXXH motif-containing putative peptide modification protein [Streptomyces scopuliridis]|uniref:aKG-HExxH-type peptide beta-hydroxylase n=1 Tax=Streptomyces scopuliridis TaxID=452529 RepID=UPI002DDAB8E2|nr:HEXXH motif-containing putative peptide modification protein [Streptomyces scopuliridis]WSB33457.1 HEXXH motif-containing putative peptide modification protein [Streptomyces scopuliridis]